MTKLNGSYMIVECIWLEKERAIECILWNASLMELFLQ